MLREFDLDAPRNSGDIRKKFRFETRCVTALFERCFVGQVKVGKVWKLLIEGVPEIIRPKARDLLGVLAVEQVCDIGKFLALPAFKKKVATLELLDAGIETICAQNSWNISPFRHASIRVKELKYVNEWIWTKPFKNPDSLAVVEVVCRHEIDEFTVYLRIIKKPHSPPRTVRIASVPPTEFIFSHLLGTARWENSEFKLFSDTGDSVGSIRDV